MSIMTVTKSRRVLTHITHTHRDTDACLSPCDTNESVAYLAEVYMSSEGKCDRYINNIFFHSKLKVHIRSLFHR